MAYECCASLAFLHSKGMMHCDIKSLNFLVGSDLSIKLADLGEARDYAGFRNSEANKLPRFSCCMFLFSISDYLILIHRNINWSAPEVLSSTPSEINWRADIWSLAMVITEILSGEVPFDSPICRSMPLDQFLTSLAEDMRPQIPSKVETVHPWIKDMVNV